MRTPEEVEALSRTFAADWRPGDHIMTWLKRHEGKTEELSNLVRDGWSWTDVGRAMAVAGIHYRSGEPMTAAILRKKASEARAAVRSRNVADPRNRPPVQPAARSLHSTQSSVVQSGLHKAEPLKAGPVEPSIVDDEPKVEFRPVRLKRYEEMATPEFVEREGDAEIIARVLGVSALTSDEKPKFRPAKLASHWSGTKSIKQEVKPLETNRLPAQPPTINADEVIARLLGKLPPIMPAADAPTTGKGKMHEGREGPAPASPLSKAASLVSAGTRILEQTRAALRQEPRASKTAEEQKARVDRLLSQRGPKVSRSAK